MELAGAPSSVTTTLSPLSGGIARAGVFLIRLARQQSGLSPERAMARLIKCPLPLVSPGVGGVVHWSTAGGGTPKPPVSALCLVLPVSSHLEFSRLVWPEEKFSPSRLQPGLALEDLQRWGPP